MASKSVTSTVVDELDENNGKKPTMVNIKKPTNGSRKNTKILYNTSTYSQRISCNFLIMHSEAKHQILKKLRTIFI